MELVRANPKKRAAIKCLLENISVEDQKHILRDLSSLSLHKDIIGNLPNEVAQNILQRLDPDDLVFFRLVSKRWMNILSDESFCKVFCNRWFHTSAPSVGPDGAFATWNATFLRLACSRHALIYGRPWAVAYRDELHITDSTELITYCEGKMACYGLGVVHYMDLRTGRTKTYHIPNNAKVRGLRITKIWLVAIAEGHCWAHNLESFETISLPITCARYRIWDVFEDFVVLGRYSQHAAESNSKGTETFYISDCHTRTAVWNLKLNESCDMEIQWPQNTEYVAFTSIDKDLLDLAAVIRTKSHVWLGKVQKNGTIILDECLKCEKKQRWTFEPQVSCNKDVDGLRCGKKNPSPTDTCRPSPDLEAKLSEESRQVNRLNRLPKLARNALYTGPKFAEENSHLTIFDQGQQHKCNILSSLTWNHQRIFGLAECQVTDDVVYQFKNDPENGSTCLITNLVDEHIVMDTDGFHYEDKLYKSECYPVVGIRDNAQFGISDGVKAWIDSEMLVLVDTTESRLSPVVFFFDRGLRIADEQDLYRIEREEDMQTRLTLIRWRRKHSDLPKRLLNNTKCSIYPRGDVGLFSDLMCNATS